VTSLMTFGFRLLNDLPEVRRVMMIDDGACILHILKYKQYPLPNPDEIYQPIPSQPTRPPQSDQTLL